MTALYVYCIVKAAAAPSMARVPPGLPGAGKPEAVKVSESLWLIGARVPLDTYGGTALERGLADLDWVGRIALAHEAVVEHFTAKRGSTVVPMKLFTMFSNAERAVAEIAGRRVAIDRTMRRIAGAEEWGVRVVRAVTAASEPSAKATRAASGTAFLRARKQARDDARFARAAAAEAAANAYERLQKLARDATRRQLDAPSGTVPPLLDAAFLVESKKRAAFARAAEREAEICARAGAQMTLSGPWPAYNFVQGSERTR
ncbi:MAG TPA: GvpL/GvpF family gas vesicle protein [Vicinamibacterales bacterium]|nr:GvpL/GvpF family gas vesicle protein [Vicinamibacterales bacterium]